MDVAEMLLLRYPLSEVELGTDLVELAFHPYLVQLVVPRD